MYLLSDRSDWFIVLFVVVCDWPLRVITLQLVLGPLIETRSEFYSSIRLLLFHSFIIIQLSELYSSIRFIVFQ